MRRASRTVGARIHKVSGQLQAIETMLKDKRSCSDVLNQLSAVRAGIEQIAVLVFQNELQKQMKKKKLTAKDIHYLSSVFSKTT